ncbi:hypothetical protein EGH10_20740 [Brevibacillus laterosporus]|uniref:Uncharacterized protein n=1 Tax=Brevibacillus laterosporus LMG 15441 TaxID=1042163 RepID=A0A075RDH7_BRELA|nr:hypothetical protein [Brevibacillus laterosporus]AIG27465.1 hypothetical protein BRLA_c031530 [Brevibacillus laterosporus LMG 15441]RJL15385.1 hypothetical protein DM460_00375 [Brevibacillus laterosporus]TPH06451.1 hypothetical protein EGH10_20740 [Brevibacillus laterosporus]
MSADDFNRRQAEILARNSNREMSLMLPVSGQAVCDAARKRTEDFCKEYGVEIGEVNVEPR